MNQESQDGAVAVIVAVFVSFVAIVMLAFATDIGSLWQSQRALVTDTDAAALAGAIELAEGYIETGECARARARAEATSVLLDRNNPDDEVVTVEANCQEDGFPIITGYAQMTARQPSPGFISGRELRANGTTTAVFELELWDAQGFAVCRNLFDGSGAANSNFVISLNGTDYLLFPYKFAEQTLNNNGWGPQCSVDPSISGAPNTAGGWGFLDGGCTLDAEGLLCEVGTGVGTDGLKKTFGGKQGERFVFPIYDEAVGVGSKARYRVVGQAEATLVGACEGGSGPFLPENCRPDRNGRWDSPQAQPGFIVVSDWSAEFFPIDGLRESLIVDLSYSICDVDGSNRYCPQSAP